MLHINQLSKHYGGETILSNISFSLNQGERVALVGPNGCGKTTLLRLITKQLKPTMGEIYIGSGINLGYVAQEQEVLAMDSTPYDTIQTVSTNMTQTDIRRFLHRFLFVGDEVFIKNHHLSSGQRTRLMLALLVAEGCNFLLLDEPLNHLDIKSREHFEQALTQFPGTILAVVHDRAFIKRVATNVWQVEEGTIRKEFGV